MADEKCTKCGATLDTEGSPKHCKKCRAAYMRNYRESELDRARSEGFVQGKNAFRRYLIENFVNYASAGWTGLQLAQLLTEVDIETPPPG